MLGDMLRAVASLSCSSHRELELSSLLWPLASSWRMAICGSMHQVRTRAAGHAVLAVGHPLRGGVPSCSTSVC